MATLETYPAQFINLDVDLKSSLNLTAIKEYLDPSVSILTCDFFQDDFFLSMEPILNEDITFDAHSCTEYMLNVLEQLPTQYQELMKSSTCSFDYGFEGGANDYKPLHVELTTSQLARMAALNVTIKITIYPYHPDRVLRAPNIIAE